MTTRNKVIDMVRAHPGMAADPIAKKLNIPMKAVVTALNQLVAFGLLLEVRTGLNGDYNQPSFYSKPEALAQLNNTLAMKAASVFKG